eukprot:9390592-Pyramimonas_sp.AAC.1
MEASPQETFHKKPNPETPGTSTDGRCGSVALSIANPSTPKKRRAPWRQAGCFLAWAPTVPLVSA